MNYEEAMSNCIFRFKSGSHAYGTNVEGSDEDYRGVFMAPLREAFDIYKTSYVDEGPLGDHMHSVIKSLKAHEFESAMEHARLASMSDFGDLKWGVETVGHPEQDEELHELRKFLKLAAECNPNIAEFLFVEKGITHCTPAWERLRDNRHLFLSKKARHTFSGYAVAQLKRIVGHRGYLMNPPDHKPTRQEFGLKDETIVQLEHHAALIALPAELVNPEMRDYVIREKQYQTKKNDWDSYEEWKKNRNKKRAELEANFGYDTKHASHLVRLIRMAKEILSGQGVIVHRPDAEELLSIRRGEWSYEKLVEYAEGMDAELKEIYEKSPLPNKPNKAAIAKLYLEMAGERYGLKF